MRVALVVLASVVVLPAVAAAEHQIWTSFTAQARLGEQSGPALWLDLHDRRRSDSTLVIIRPAIGYAFSPSLLVHLGYVYSPTLADEGATTHEQRIWQQVLANHAVGDALKLQGRVRFEQRWGPGDLGYRLRLNARGQYQPSADVPLQLVVIDEVFFGFNDTDWAAKKGFDQNRLFVGLGTDTKLKGLRVEVGYMNVYLNVQDRFDNILAINLSSNHVF